MLRAYLDEGAEYISRKVMRWASRHLDFENDSRWRSQVLKTARPFFLQRECSIFGPIEPTLTATNRHTIRALLTARRQSWEESRTPPPRCVDVYTRRPLVERVAVAVLMPQYINCSPTALDHDITYHVLQSALSASHKAVHVPADEFTYGGTSDLPAALARLEAVLGDLRPQLVVIDGNFIPNGRTIDAATLQACKQKLGFKVLSIVGDCYDHQKSDFLGYWHRVADLSVIFHSRTRYYELIDDKTKVLVAPALPFHEQTFAPEGAIERDLDLSYVGSRNSRNRIAFIDAAAAGGIKVFARYHNRMRHDAPSIEQYAVIMKRSKMVFTNGWIDSGDDIITGRVGETVLAGACLLHEVGTPINDYLVPFVHYIPVANISQFVAYCQFLAEDSEARATIAGAGRSFWLANYSSAAFWATVHERLFATAQPVG